MERTLLVELHKFGAKSCFAERNSSKWWLLREDISDE
jgi:hypothetical protein